MVVPDLFCVRHELICSPIFASAAFISVMQNIHRAGVRHHDPRVENLMVQADGNVAIIDRVELDASQSSKTRELEYLQDILDDIYPGPS